MVAFAFTDFPDRKRRPALVVSPEGFSAEASILWAITSQIPAKLTEREVILEAKDMANERLPIRSMIKVGKLFTMHRSLVAARLGAVKEEKLLEVIDQLRRLFVASQASPEDAPREREGPVPPKIYDDTEGLAGL